MKQANLDMCNKKNATMLWNIIFYILRGLIQHTNIQNYYPTGKKLDTNESISGSM